MERPVLPVGDQRRCQGSRAPEYWKKLGLEAAALAAFIIADIATFGGATFLIAIGVGMGVSAVKAHEADEKAQNMGALGQTNVKASLATVYKGQVTAAEAEAESEKSPWC